MAGRMQSAEFRMDDGLSPWHGCLIPAGVGVPRLFCSFDSPPLISSFCNPQSAFLSMPSAFYTLNSDFPSNGFH
jgi:hypothetical protein